MDDSVILLFGDDARRRKKVEMLSEVGNKLRALAFGGPAMPVAKTPMEFMAACRTAGEGLVDRLTAPEAKWGGTACDPMYQAVNWGTFLLSQPKWRMDDAWNMAKFYGAGVYAIGYDGAHPAFASVSGKDWFLYVGKSDSQTPFGTTSREQGRKLWQRACREQYGNISGRHGLKTKDFWLRFHPIASSLQQEAEGQLIRLFRPVFNKESRWVGRAYPHGICSGFGKHGDKKRCGNRLSAMETAFPAHPLTHSDYPPNARAMDAILGDIKKWLEETVPMHGADAQWLASIIDSLE